jgi:hypothetical protein
MAKIVVYTKTTTWTTRIEVIQEQVNIALYRTTDLSVEFIQESILKDIENKSIFQVNVYGLDSENLCRVQLSMKIDWDKHDVQIANGQTTVVIDDDGRKWIDNTPIELNKAISLFKDYASEYSLKTKCHTVYAPTVNREEANRILNLVPAKPIQWKDKADGFEFEIPEIKELRVGFYCVD